MTIYVVQSKNLDYDGVELLIENLPPHPWYFGGQWLTNAFMDMYEIRDFLDSMGLMTCYDTSHINSIAIGPMLISTNKLQ